MYSTRMQLIMNYSHDRESEFTTEIDITNLTNISTQIQLYTEVRCQK